MADRVVTGTEKVAGTFGCQALTASVAFLIVKFEYSLGRHDFHVAPGLTGGLAPHEQVHAQGLRVVHVVQLLIETAKIRGIIAGLNYRKTEVFELSNSRAELRIRNERINILMVVAVAVLGVTGRAMKCQAQPPEKTACSRSTRTAGYWRAMRVRSQVCPYRDGSCGSPMVRPPL